MITEVQHDVVVVRWRRRRRHERWQSGIKVRLARVTGGVSVVGVYEVLVTAAWHLLQLFSRMCKTKTSSNIQAITY